METPQQFDEAHWTTPVPASLPPAEGRDDIGREEECSTVFGESAIISPDPVEGRNDIAEDVEQERQQSYQASREDVG
ncbi:hypothetical protein [Ktedonospora formicarum]|uniref:Uncharacterized protein n=1 Tax=Ktedonospora formicarum TaxID=2778364 RepID=A0A8J3HWV2_9CHLR|nr:hypothetical protein [Ktedonospora formicarum]GHO42338.1 hypothetical protein KSX_05010 [Ktedonospora formicarum]